MNRTFHTNKQPFLLELEFKSSQQNLLKIEVQDKLKPWTMYFKKEIKIDGVNKFKIKFPHSPSDLIFKIYPSEYKSYNEYVQFGRTRPKTFQIVKTEITKLIKESAFSRAIQKFAVDAVVIV